MLILTLQSQQASLEVAETSILSLQDFDPVAIHACIAALSKQVDYEIIERYGR